MCQALREVVRRLQLLRILLLVEKHYLMIEVKGRKLKANMNRMEIKDGAIHWTKPDSITIKAPATLDAANKSEH